MVCLLVRPLRVCSEQECREKANAAKSLAEASEAEALAEANVKAAEATLLDAVDVEAKAAAEADQMENLSLIHI